MIELKNFGRKINEAICFIFFGTESTYTLDSDFFSFDTIIEINKRLRNRKRRGERND